MGEILHGWGCRVIAAATEEALQEQIAAQPRRPDLIIADHHLAHGSSGLQVIERLHDRLGAAIPALLISGDTAPETLRDAGTKGFHLLHKPVSPLRLRALLQQLLSPRLTN
jgi:CheY-like chemotaxis protein